MKRIFFCISLIISQAAMAGKTHTIELDEYWFRGTLNEMVDSLQERLAGEISVVCEKSPIKMNSLTINFKKGELAGSDL